jgi:hypothetical protein
MRRDTGIAPKQSPATPKRCTRLEHVSGICPKNGFFSTYSYNMFVLRTYDRRGCPVKFIVRRHDILDLGRQLGFLQNYRVDQHPLIRTQIPAPFSSASALFAAIALLSNAFVSSSAFGGSSGRSL